MVCIFSSMNNVFYLEKYFVWQGDSNEECPNVNFIPSLIRRRLTLIEKIGIFITNNLLPIGENVKIIFASRFGEWRETIKLIEQMYNEKEMSPAGFSHSVHNAALGMFTIINKLKNNYTTIASNEDTIDSSLLEAISSKEDVLLVYTEEPIPDFYKEVNKDITEEFKHGFGFGVLLSKNIKCKDVKENVRKILIDTTSFDINKNTSFLEVINFLNGNNKKFQSKYFLVKG